MENQVIEITETEGNLVIHARREMEMAQLNDPGADYDGGLYEAVVELMKVFSNQGHSGMSALMTIDLFSKLARYEPLSPITSNPDEWFCYTEAGTEPLWQSKRKPSVFSKDGGATWYDLNDVNQNQHLSASQKAIVELDKRKPEIKQFYEDYSKAVEALIAEYGINSYFQDDEGTVYKSHMLDGKFVKYDLYGVKRTRKEGEASSSTNLSIKEAQEAGFTLSENQ